MRSVVSNPTVGDANRDARSSPQGAAVQLGTSVQPSVANEYVDYRFMVQLARLMKADVFVPNESLPRGRLFVINKGAVRNHTSILEPYSSFGMEDVILVGDVLPRPNAFALNYVHTLSCRREELLSLLEEFPDAFKSIKYWCVLQAVGFFVTQQVRILDIIIPHSGSAACESAPRVRVRRVRECTACEVTPPSFRVPAQLLARTCRQERG